MTILLLAFVSFWGVVIVGSIAYQAGYNRGAKDEHRWRRNDDAQARAEQLVDRDEGDWWKGKEGKKDAAD